MRGIKWPYDEISLSTVHMKKKPCMIQHMGYKDTQITGDSRSGIKKVRGLRLTLLMPHRLVAYRLNLYDK